VELAISALENDVKRPRMAEVAVPHNQCAVGFENLEGVRAVALDSHRDRKGWYKASNRLQTSCPGKRLVGRGRQRTSGRR
jgi:hypothetical protein